MSLFCVVSQFNGEIETLIPWTLCDIMEQLDGERERTGLSSPERHMWELVESRCLQQRESPVSNSPFHLFALLV